MLTITKKSTNRVDIDLSGALDAEAMEHGLQELIADAASVHNGRMLYTIADFEWPTWGALSVELQLLPKLIGLISKFDRCAVVAEAQWMRTAAEIEGALFPGLEIKAFTPAEREEAEAWLEAA